MKDVRERMYQALEGEDVEVACAVLELLKRAEDRAAIPHVERLLAEERCKHTPRLNEKARECLDALRKERKDAGSKLLRPAEVPPEALLRPAASKADEEPALLLRPHEE